MRRIAVCPGSFDPVTLGHLDIITRASKLFDKVIVLISRNAGKAQPSFTATERMLMIQQSAACRRLQTHLAGRTEERT